MKSPRYGAATAVLLAIAFGTFLAIHLKVVKYTNKFELHACMCVHFRAFMQSKVGHADLPSQQYGNAH